MTADCRSPAAGRSRGARKAPLLIALFLAVQPATGAEGPPVVGEPDHFNGAVGRFTVATSAEPAKLQAEDPLTYTVRVTATGKVTTPPARPALAEFPGFSDGFYIDDLAPPEGKRVKETWEFAYRLKPKNTEVKSVPSFPFVFWQPGYRPPRKGYMTVYAPAIPITVTPKGAVGGGTTAAKPITGPEAAFALAGGDALRRDDDHLPGVAALVLLLLAPPLGCVAWYFAWRRLYPDAARLARRHRSRAAREALKALRGAGKRAPDEQARRAAAAVARYLRNRLELTAAEPTPAEAEAHLREQGVPAPLAARAAAFFRACDVVRFDPQPPPPADLAESATKLVLALEAETWAE